MRQSIYIVYMGQPVVCMHDGRRDDLSLTGRANQPVNAGQGELVRGGDERLHPRISQCFAQLNSESVIVHVENLMRKAGSGASGSHQGDPLDCRLSHRRETTRI